MTQISMEELPTNSAWKTILWPVQRVRGGWGGQRTNKTCGKDIPGGGGYMEEPRGGGHLSARGLWTPAHPPPWPPHPYVSGTAISHLPLLYPSD